MLRLSGWICWLQLSLLFSGSMAIGQVSEQQAKLASPWIFRQSCLASITLPQEPALPIGFSVADVDHDSSLSRGELRKYLRPRLKGIALPYAKIFNDLDLDNDDKLTEPEFEPRNEIIQKYVESLYPPMEIAADPGVGYKIFGGLDRPTDDALAYSAIYHRTLEAANSLTIPEVDVEAIPRSLPGCFQRISDSSSLQRACNATVVLGGGKSDEEFFTGGGVIVSPEGLMLTNYHIVVSINDGLIAMLAEGRIAKIEKIIAANPESDVAIVKLEGKDFPFVPVAATKPLMSSDIAMIHHSDNRFYTYDRGYVKRYPKLQGSPWMEISAPFAPGGSGCGIFNERFELVGLVCYISVGDGPSMAADPPDEADDDSAQSMEQPTYLEMSDIVVRLAVPLQAMQLLWEGP